MERFTQRLILFFLVLTSSLHAQEAVKSCTISKTKNNPVLDGLLNDSCWLGAETVTGFIQLAPDPGNPSRQRTEVKVLYGTTDLFVGAMMFDSSPDSMLSQLGPRDDFDESNAEFFGFLLDTYRDHQNAFSFNVSIAGVQTDAKIKGGEPDGSWNAVWGSKTKTLANGWSAEFRIPYSALRFTNDSVQQWGINFYRILQRSKEWSFWNPLKPEVSGIVNQSGILKGIENIASPVRLSLLPYASAYGENYDGATSYSINGGMDVKYGLSESFTLDMTLIPDFGQTRYDDKVLNLSPFEVKYDERRYFFTEGTDLFKINDLFYSRRVGGTPLYYEDVYDQLGTNETIIENPSSGKLYNAVKISGRTSSKLGIGVFNAVSAPAYTVAEDTLTGTQRNILSGPLTNYNVLAMNQALKNNSYVSFINTNVMRDAGSYDVNVSGMQFKFADKKNLFAVDGSGDLSQKFYNDSTQYGNRYFIRVGKISGNYLINVKHQRIDAIFDPNDMGFLEKRNTAYYIINQEYNIYKPFWIINKIQNEMGIDYFRVVNPNRYTRFNVDGGTSIQFKNFYSLSVEWAVQPFTNYDYYEPRSPGRYYVYPKNYRIESSVNTDGRKRFAAEVLFIKMWFIERDRSSSIYMFSPRYRFSDKLMLGYSFFLEKRNDDVGFVDNINDSIYFGVRDAQTISNTLSGSFIFTSTMSLSLEARHYWSWARYKDYFLLNETGKVTETEYAVDHKINFNAFNLFLSYTWQFSPGSELSVVYQNAIFSEDNVVINNYSDNTDYLFRQPQSNSISVKAIYYLDYLSLKKKK